MDRQKIQGYVPFDLYDIFAYLFPGIVAVVYLVLFIDLAIPQGNSWIHEAITFVAGLPWFMALFLTVTFVVIVYVIGFFIGALGSIFFDRILIEGIYGYPVSMLLALPRNKRDYSEATHRYLFLMLNIMMILPTLISEYTLFYRLTSLSALVVLVLVVLRVAIKWFKTTFGTDSVKSVSDHGVIRWIYLTPSRILEWCENHILKAVLGMDAAFPSQFKTRYKKLFKKTFGMDAEQSSSENYWLAYFKATNNNPSVLSLLRNWLHLYAFARNLATASFFCGLGFVAWLYYHEEAYLASVRILMIIMLFVAWVFMVRYWILYQNYHTKNVLRAFVASMEDNDRKKS